MINTIFHRWPQCPKMLPLLPHSAARCTAKLCKLEYPDHTVTSPNQHRLLCLLLWQVCWWSLDDDWRQTKNELTFEFKRQSRATQWLRNQLKTGDKAARGNADIMHHRDQPRPVWQGRTHLRYLGSKNGNWWIAARSGTLQTAEESKLLEKLSALSRKHKTLHPFSASVVIQSQIEFCHFPPGSLWWFCVTYGCMI